MGYSCIYANASIKVHMYVLYDFVWDSRKASKCISAHLHINGIIYLFVAVMMLSVLRVY